MVTLLSIDPMGDPADVDGFDAATLADEVGF
jgi:hypothetical protein